MIVTTTNMNENNHPSPNTNTNNNNNLATKSPRKASKTTKKISTSSLLTHSTSSSTIDITNNTSHSSSNNNKYTTSPSPKTTSNKSKSPSTPKTTSTTTSNNNDNNKQSPSITMDPFLFHPEDMSNIPFAPTLYPTEEQFRNPIEYIESIQAIGEKYGIVKIVPPELYFLEPAENFSDLGINPGSIKFICKIQNIHQLQFRNAFQAKKFKEQDLMERNKEIAKNEFSNSPLKRKVFELFPTSSIKRRKNYLSINDDEELKELNNNNLNDIIETNIKDESNNENNKAIIINEESNNNLINTIINNENINDNNTFNLSPNNNSLQNNKKGNKRKSREMGASSSSTTGEGQDDNFGFDRTIKPMSLGKYKEMADEFFINYFKNRKEKSNTFLQQTQQLNQQQSQQHSLQNDDVTCQLAKKSTKKLARNGGLKRLNGISYYNDDLNQLSFEDFESEYWRIVNNENSENVTVYYGNDLPVTEYPTLFPQGWKCDWDANKLAKVPESLLSYLTQDIAGVNVPMLYIGMLFSSFCWHVEDHFLYAMNFIHQGACKQWYGIPGYAAEKFENVFKKMFPNLFVGQPAILHMLVTQISPSILQREGVPVYKLVHEPGSFVITFPRAYHSGFNLGFNIAESVNFSTCSWLKYNRIALDKYYETKRATTFPTEQLIISAITSFINKERKDSKFYDTTCKYLFDELKYFTEKERDLRFKVMERLENKTIRQMPQISNRKVTKIRKCSQKDNQITCCKCNMDCYLSAVNFKPNRKQENYYCLKCALSEMVNDKIFLQKSQFVERLPMKELDDLLQQFEPFVKK
ncbi:hypothetical protein ABK040_003232 [Willaertia magna]